MKIRNNKVVKFLRSYRFSLILLSFFLPTLIAGAISSRIYHSFWFALLLFLLSVNLTFCTISNLGRRRGRFFSKLKAEIWLEEGFNFPPNLLIDVLKGEKYKLNTKKCKDSSLLISAERGGWKRFASPLAHIGVLIILVGAAVGGLGGFREWVRVKVGTLVGIPNKNFSLKISKLEFHKNSPEISASIIENGRKVFAGLIKVNAPLCFRGVKILISSYGYEDVEEVTIGVRNGEFRKLRLKVGKKTPIPTTSLEVKIAKFIPDFRIKGGEVFSASRSFNNPACELEVYDGGTLIFKSWIFLKFPNFHGLISKHKFTLLNFTKPPKYALLQITSNPGLGTIWVGCGILLVGVFSAFYISNKKVWLFLERGKLVVYGKSDREYFEREFSQLIQKIRMITPSAKGVSFVSPSLHSSSISLPLDKRED
jgi:cytochrome c biogenesis protein